MEDSQSQDGSRSARNGYPDVILTLLAFWEKRLSLVGCRGLEERSRVSGCPVATEAEQLTFLYRPRALQFIINHSAYGAGGCRVTAGMASGWAPSEV